MFTRKPLGHVSLNISLYIHRLRASHAPILGLHEGNFGLHPITFSLDEEST